MSKDATDGLVAGGLIASPAWAPWLSQLNDVLTTLTLIVGLGLGAARLADLLRKRRPRR